MDTSSPPFVRQFSFFSFSHFLVTQNGPSQLNSGADCKRKDPAMDDFDISSQLFADLSDSDLQDSDDEELDETKTHG